MLPSMSGVINRPTVSVDEAINKRRKTLAAGAEPLALTKRKFATQATIQKATGLFSQLIAAERGESPGQEHRRDAIQA